MLYVLSLLFIIVTIIFHEKTGGSIWKNSRTLGSHEPPCSEKTDRSTDEWMDGWMDIRIPVGSLDSKHLAGGSWWKSSSRKSVLMGSYLNEHDKDGMERGGESGNVDSR